MPRRTGSAGSATFLQYFFDLPVFSGRVVPNRNIVAHKRLIVRIGRRLLCENTAAATGMPNETRLMLNQQQGGSRDGIPSFGRSEP
jgi:hypothetical protein